MKTRLKNFVRSLFTAKLALLIGLSYMLACATLNKQEIQFSDNLFTAYSDLKHYTIFTKKSAQTFLDNYYAKLEKTQIKNLRPKQDYLDKFRERKNLSNENVQWVAESYKEFKTRFPNTEWGQLFGFHFSNFKHPKTLIVIKDPISYPGFMYRFFNRHHKEIKGYNLVFIDLKKVLRTASLDADKINKLFASDMRRFQKNHLSQQSRVAYNVICHSFLVSYQFLQTLKTNEFVFFYSPMVKKTANDGIIHPKSIFEKGKRYFNFAEMFYMYSIPRGRYFNTQLVVKDFDRFELDAESSLMDLYFSGLTTDGINHKYLIYAGKSDLFTGTNHDVKNFENESVYKLDGIHHSEFYSTEKGQKLYFSAVSDILKKAQ